MNSFKVHRYSSMVLAFSSFSLFFFFFHLGKRVCFVSLVGEGFLVGLFLILGGIVFQLLSHV